MIVLHISFGVSILLLNMWAPFVKVIAKRSPQALHTSWIGSISWPISERPLARSGARRSGRSSSKGSSRFFSRCFSPSFLFAAESVGRTEFIPDRLHFFGGRKGERSPRPPLNPSSIMDHGRPVGRMAHFCRRLRVRVARPLRVRGELVTRGIQADPLDSSQEGESVESLSAGLVIFLEPPRTFFAGALHVCQMIRESLPCLEGGGIFGEDPRP